MDEVIAALGEVATWADDALIEWDAREMVAIKNATVDYGCALGLDPARKDAALDAFRAALTLSESGVRGYDADDIRDFIAELEQKGSLTPRLPPPGAGRDG